MAPKNSGRITKIKAKLTAAFSIIDMGPINYYLNLQNERNRKQKTIKLSQSIHIDKIVHSFGFQNAKPANISINDSLLLPNNKTATKTKIRKFQEMVNSIMFVMIEIRPNIIFAASMLAVLKKNPEQNTYRNCKTHL